MEIKLLGSYYEQGLIHGRSAKEQIETNIEIIKSSLKTKRVDFAIYNSVIDQFFSNVFSNNPEIEEEINGIAEGSELPLYDIKLLNANFSSFTERMRASEECSAIVASSSATLDKKTYIIKNRDMHDRVLHVVLSREFSDGTRITEVDMAGSITFPGSGINNHGFALTTTGVGPTRIPLDLELIGHLAFTFTPHTLLRICKNVDDALAYLRDKNPYKVTRSNLLLVDNQKAVVVETTENQCCIIEQENGLLVRTNHFHSPDLQKYNPSHKDYPSTYSRFDRAMEMLQLKRGSLRFQDMLQIASDHENGPCNSICRHEDGKGSLTVYSSIIIVEDNQLWTAIGNPCLAFFETSA